MNKLLVLFLLIAPIRAAEYALVMGGTSSKAESNHHEFARGLLSSAMGLRAQGREVTTLFGHQGVEEQLTMFDRMKKNRGEEVYTEKEKYQKDYHKISSEFPKTQAMTRENILSVLQDHLTKMQRGDKFTMILNAHGYVECSQVPNNSDNLSNVIQQGYDLVDNDLDPACHHEISVSSPTGEMVKIKTNEIFPLLKEMEKKGIEVNAVFESCHSGILKREMEGLENTCAAFLSTANAPGYGCFEDDPPQVHDYTSTLEYINFQTYANIADDLAKDPYFSDSNCLGKVSSHARSLGIDFNTSTIADVYWAARSKDQALHEPSISDVLEIDYFKQGYFTNQFIFSIQKVCTPDMLREISSVLPFLPDAMKALFQKELLGLEYSLNTYNNLIDNQLAIKANIDALSENDERTKADLYAQLEATQLQTKKAAANVVAQERTLTPFFKTASLESRKNNACDRTL